MGKARQSNKEPKKKAVMSPKDRKNAKQAKKNSPVVVPLPR